MSIVIDGLDVDNNIARLDVDGDIIEFPVSALPEGCKEGDMLSFVIMDSSEVIALAEARISRLQKMSGMNSDNGCIDL